MPKDVLVVEDEALIRIDIADALADEGIMAWEAADADEALLMLETHPQIGLLFTDVDMPGSMNGLQLAHLVVERRPDLAIVVTSGAVMMSDQDLPCAGTFLMKPYPPSRVVELVTRKLDCSGTD